MKSCGRTQCAPYPSSLRVLVPSWLNFYEKSGYIRPDPEITTMQKPDAEVVVAGNICLDIIPSLGSRVRGLDELFFPGNNIETEGATISIGGAVVNTGVALHRIGVGTRLLAKIGDDAFGGAILKILSGHERSLTDDIIVAAGKNSSFTIVISPPGIDRIFIHYPGTNADFGADDMKDENIAGARLFHFGYPPSLHKTYANGGVELLTIFRRAKALGLTTSLDMAKPDPDSAAGKVDWREISKRVLPYVDLYLPSVEETLFMLERDRFERLIGQYGPDKVISGVDGPLLGSLADILLDMGAAVVVLKLGEQGLFIKTSDEKNRIVSMGRCAPQNVIEWTGREFLAPCYRVNVAGTTGAGDVTIAGFIAGMLKGLSPEDTASSALSAGAFCVENLDGASGIPPWQAIQERIRSRHARRDISLHLPDWKWDDKKQIMLGPDDKNIGSMK